MNSQPPIPSPLPEPDERPIRAKDPLLICPFCEHAFELTWKRYWKTPTGKHRCPLCHKLSKLKRSPWSYLPSALGWYFGGSINAFATQQLLGWFFGGGIGAFATQQLSWQQLSGITTFWAVCAWIIGGLLIGTIIDKHLDPRLGKMVKIDNDE